MDNFDKDFLEEKKEEEISTEENIEATESDGTEDDVLYDDIPFAAEKIYIPETLKDVPQCEKKGLRIFCILIAITVLLSCFATGGYFLGKNSVKSYIGKDVTVDLADKPEGAEPDSATNVYYDVSESIVGIFVYNDSGSAYVASGIVYTEDGYIVTTDSMFASISSAKFKVMTSDKKEYDAVFVAGDARSDVAVIKIQDSVKLTPATLADSSKALNGETVYSIGYANGYDNEPILSDGIISMNSVRVASSITNYSSRMIGTTATANPGMFGGGLANEYGQIVGMLSTKNMTTGFEQSSYAVPTTTVKTIAEALIKDGKAPDRARIGISYIAKNSAAAEVEKLYAPGLQVAEVSNESELFNSLKVGDIITKINGIDVMTDDTVLDIIESLSPGDKITLTVVTEKGTTADYSAKLLKYESYSSYKTTSDLPDNDGNSNGGTFDFPEGY